METVKADDNAKLGMTVRTLKFQTGLHTNQKEKEKKKKKKGSKVIYMDLELFLF